LHVDVFGFSLAVGQRPDSVTNDDFHMKKDILQETLCHVIELEVLFTTTFNPFEIL
jgi:hypothetical protein